jgi:D-serine deaminase-like pyridoxal phosphate-dependent protein
MNFEDRFPLESAGKSLAELQTPVPLIDVAIVERNIRKWQDRSTKLGLANRPHIKTHKLAALARLQLDEGAKGITVQKLSEAEAMAKAGITDMLLTFNAVGRPKLERLSELARTTQISVVADGAAVVEGIAEAGKSAGRDIKVLVECDTGANRNGVQSPQAALALAKTIDATQGVSIGGLMTYPKAGMRKEMDGFLAEAVSLFKANGLSTETISIGGSPDMWKDEGLSSATEYRAGTYIYFDRSLVARGTCTWDECALTVLVTVVSTPTPERAIIDAGTKALTSDLLGLAGYGAIAGSTDATVYDANEEHGFVGAKHLPAKPRIGDLLRIVPNHVCPVSNLFDKVVFIRGQTILGAMKVDARGCVQ